jgi:hypothetical protein
MIFILKFLLVILATIKSVDYDLFFGKFKIKDENQELNFLGISWN